LKKWENGIGRQISEVEVDMAPFIGKTDGKHRIQFAKCEVPNCYLDIEFKLSESSEGAGGDESGDEEVKGSFASPDNRRNEDEINQLNE
jgi:hypothetical protein